MSSKDSGASTADNEKNSKKAKAKDLHQLTLLEKSHLK
jgi:hypothetical protein